MATIISTWRRPGEVAIRAAQAKIDQGGSLLDSLEAGLAAAEDHPEMIAIGRGSLPNTDGEIELDASVMRGSDLSCGAVCAVRGILPIISVARLVMEKTKHVMLAGDQARRFAIENGFVPQNLVTATVAEHYKEFLKSPEAASRYVHSVADGGPDTVTMLGWQPGPEVVAASSTSGMPYKVPGRVGDSPIVGAGIYADNEAGCAGATGWGEELWKAGASLRVVEAMRGGASAQEACESVIRFMLRRQPGCDGKPIVVLAIDRLGNFGAACAGGDFDLWVTRDGEIAMHEFKSLTTG
ncbi:MAG: isoaspartyl peptidase/L-asparaginase [Fimbriimonadaceae bacterium]|nr:isoaspartyl peptidase/L-asparaginase [Fimbriimonadaceae bacterium]